MKYPLLLALSAVVLLTGCSPEHLDIFPELGDPALMEKKLTVEQMHQDMDAFIAGALQRHPDLGAYTDLDQLESVMQSYKQEIVEPMTRTQFYRVIGKLNHHLNDGHSFLIWPYQEFNQLRESGHKVFPFDVLITRSGEIRLESAYSDGQQTLQAGSRILTLNGLSGEQLLASLQQHAGGESRILREQVVAQRFGILLWAALGLIDEFSLELQRGDTLTRVDIRADQSWQKEQQVQNDAPYYYDALAEGVALVYLDHFDIDPGDFEDFVDETFAQIKKDKIHSLIIDIRNNPGGNTDTVTYLSRYLADKPFRLVSSVREKLNFDNRGWFNYKGEVGDINVEEWTDWESPMSDSKRFQGKVYLLVGSVSYSAAIVLATTLKDNEFATLVGEKTGGFANQTAQGNLFNLPHSQLRAYVATKTLVRPNEDTRRKGVEPHYVVHQSVDDIKSQRDAGIERVLELIESQHAGQE